MKSDLKHRWRVAIPVERDGLEALRLESKLRHKELLRQERRRLRKSQKRKASTTFLRNPFKASRAILGPARDGVLSCEKVAFDNHLASSYGHRERDSFSVDLTQSDAVTVPSVKFRLSKPSHGN